MIPENVRAEWAFVRSSVEQLHLYWQFHKELFGNQEHVELLMRRLPVPTTLINRAFKMSITLQVGALIDKDSKTMSIPRLLRTLEKECPACPIGQFQHTYEAVRQNCNPILAWRHKRFAHANREVVLEPESCRLPEIDESHFQKTVASFESFVSEVLRYFEGPSVTLQFQDYTGKANELFDIIRRGVESRQAEWGADLLD